jgi:hypothetical protein
MLLTTRNAFRRTENPAERGPQIDVSKPGCPREIRNTAHPFALAVSFPATARQSCLGSARARPAALTYLSMPRDQRARDASGRRMQSTCQRRAPVISASFPDSGSRGPSSSPEDGARHTATARFGLCFAARASVVYPLRHAAKPGPLMSPSPLAVHRARGPASCDRPRSLPPPPSVIGLRLRRPGNTFHPQRSPSRTLPRRSTALSAERRLTPAVSPVAVFAA